MFTKDLEELKNKDEQYTKGINNRFTEAEECINDLEDRMVEITAIEQNIEKRMERNENSLRDLWTTLEAQHSHYREEGGERDKGPENIC